MPNCGACVAAAIDFVTVDPRRGRMLIAQATEALRAKRQELSALAGVMLSGRPLPGANAPPGTTPFDGADDRGRRP